MDEITEAIKGNEYYNEINGKIVRTINPPIYHGSTILFKNFEDFHDAGLGKYQGVVYGTNRMPSQRAFEEILNKLEGGHITRAFQSGISAITNTLMAFTRAGDHILVCENVYGPAIRFCKKILSKYNVEVTYIPAAVGENIVDYIKDNTKLIFLESPGSNTFEIQDIPVIAKIAREKNILTVFDNTWATPIYFKPLALGIDVSIQSVTKYIAGHSDILLGTVSVNEKYADMFDDYYNTMEVFVSPQDCYLALRGLRTLKVRLGHHEQAALKVAKWLDGLDIIEEVIHPALENHPQHEIWKRDFSGSSGLFAFMFKKDYSIEQISAFINSLEVFGIGYSWGGFKSLVTAGTYKRSADPARAGKVIIRLNIGLEEVDDLIADLEEGFKVLGEK